MAIIIDPVMKQRKEKISEGLRLEEWLLAIGLPGSAAHRPTEALCEEIVM
jgi:hypothetical protein